MKPTIKDANDGISIEAYLFNRRHIVIISDEGHIDSFLCQIEKLISEEHFSVISLFYFIGDKKRKEINKKLKLFAQIYPENFEHFNLSTKPNEIPNMKSKRPNTNLAKIVMEMKNSFNKHIDLRKDIFVATAKELASIIHKLYDCLGVGYQASMVSWS